MKFPRSRRPRNEDERILPLTNIVFLLLIFFMLAGRLATPDPLPIEPPESEREDPARAEGVLVQMMTDDRVAIDGEVVPLAELAARVGRQGAGDDAPRVRLKADGTVAATRVVAVMQQLHDAGVDELRLLTTSASP